MRSLIFWSWPWIVLTRLHHWYYDLVWKALYKKYPIHNWVINIVQNFQIVTFLDRLPALLLDYLLHFFLYWINSMYVWDMRWKRPQPHLVWANFYKYAKWVKIMTHSYYFYYFDEVHLVWFRPLVTALCVELDLYLT